MPNWCRNTLIIKGPAADVNAFQMQARHPDPKEKSELLLQNLYPCPPSLEFRLKPTADMSPAKDGSKEALLKALQRFKEEPANPADDDWYSWRVRNWGTKWDVQASITNAKTFANGDTAVRYEFDSAWAPPEAAFEKICEDWPTLLFILNSTGEDFRGRRTFAASVDNNSVA